MSGPSGRRWRRERSTGYWHFGDDKCDYATVHWWRHPLASYGSWMSNAVAAKDFRTLKEAKAATQRALRTPQAKRRRDIPVTPDVPEDDNRYPRGDGEELPYRKETAAEPRAFPSQAKRRGRGR